MDNRPAKKNRYLIALILTIIIFTLGIIIGLFIEKLRLEQTENSMLHEKVNLQSLQLQQNFIASGNVDCTTLHEILDANIDELTRKGGIVQEFEKSAILDKDKFNLQHRDYFLTEIQYYLITKEIEKKCPKDSINVLYFYDSNKYETQGDILGYLKKIYKERLLVFSLNAEFEQEPMINVLITAHNITSYPAIVVDDELFSGHYSLKEVETILCNKFGSFSAPSPTACSTQTGNPLQKNPFIE